MAPMAPPKTAARGLYAAGSNAAKEGAARTNAAKAAHGKRVTGASLDGTPKEVMTGVFRPGYELSTNRARVHVAYRPSLKSSGSQAAAASASLVPSRPWRCASSDSL